MELKVKVKKDGYQHKFLSSLSKFPVLIAGVGTGKTMCLLVKIYEYCETYPGTSALIVRKEFTDLHDSTMKDFQNYFQCKVGSDKNYKMGNGSMIMFRHADEIAVLKNINIGIAGIEQAEEFEDDKQFQFIRDRLRQQNGSELHPLCIIANANGHNWIWNLWINKADEVLEIDSSTGQFQYIRGEYEAFTANTFANESNLPKDFVEDQKRKEADAPNHYKQYVMNSFEEMVEDDFVFNFTELMEAKKRSYAQRTGYGHKIMGFDVARYGNDKNSAIGVMQCGALIWAVFHCESWGGVSLPTSGARFQQLASVHKVDNKIIDEDGIGSGPLDYILEASETKGWQGFRNPGYSMERNRFYGNPRTEAAFKLKEYIAQGHIAIPFEELIQELMTLRYRFMNDGRRILVSKEEMRKKGVKSPNLADGLLMACSLIDEVKKEQDNQYPPWGVTKSGGRNPYGAPEENLFKIAGVR